CTVLPNGGRMLTYSDVTDLVESAAEARHVATTDGATELFNRSHFLTLAEAEWKRFQRYNRPLSLLIFDLDHFKFINERLGGDAGDRAIAHLAEVARINKRPSDILARIGGDEFALLLPETDIQRAAAVGERLREKVAQAPLEESGARMKITISVGVAEATLSMSSIAALMKAADEALYNAKLLGRNRVSFAAPVPAPTHGMAAE
ncbi:MAG TPA: GGDEF domain-containing protein, partial [Xanthobacteraceae bacterium]|nr:GGDEF domain-containing protein [Xanthobacteraceae bacterium]